MIRFLLRAFGFVLMATAFAALVMDGSRSIAAGRPLFTPLGEAAAWLGAGRVLAVAAGWSGPAQAVAAGLLAVPGWLAAAGAGLLLLYAGRPSAAGVGFSGRRT